MLRSSLSVLSCCPCVQIEERTGLWPPSSEVGFRLCCGESARWLLNVSVKSLTIKFEGIMRQYFLLLKCFVPQPCCVFSVFFFSVCVCVWGGDSPMLDYVKLQVFAGILDNFFLLCSFVCFVALHRMLHLAIIHEEEVIAQQLIQLFPKEVLDIQNNLYQVSVDI